MAPSRDTVFAKDERVLCFHLELLYEAKIIDSKLSDPKDKKSPLHYRVHYKGWKNTWDDWVPADRLRKFTEENKQLAQSLKGQMDDLRRASAPKSTKKKAAESDFSSTRDSEDRQLSIAGTGRGLKRGRDCDAEKFREANRHLPLSDYEQKRTPQECSPRTAVTHAPFEAVRAVYLSLNPKWSGLTIRQLSSESTFMATKAPKQAAASGLQRVATV
ncbi:MAG: hypothetical protein Q9163_003307 [Psora crenata]